MSVARPCNIVRNERSALCGTCGEFRNNERDFVCPKRKTAMTAEELRAMTAQGPAVVMVARDDMLRLLDEQERLRSSAKRWERAAAAFSLLLAMTAWLAAWVTMP